MEKKQDYKEPMINVLKVNVEDIMITSVTADPTTPAIGDNKDIYDVF